MTGKIYIQDRGFFGTRFSTADHTRLEHKLKFSFRVAAARMLLDRLSKWGIEVATVNGISSIESLSFFFPSFAQFFLFPWRDAQFSPFDTIR